MFSCVSSQIALNSVGIVWFANSKKRLKSGGVRFFLIFCQSCCCVLFNTLEGARLLFKASMVMVDHGDGRPGNFRWVERINKCIQ